MECDHETFDPERPPDAPTITLADIVAMQTAIGPQCDTMTIEEWCQFPAPNPVLDRVYDAKLNSCPPPPVAGITIPAPDPAAQPGPEANVIRVFQWPPHCGQWYARVGSPGDRRSIQYGPLRTAAEVLEGMARHLAARGHRFDGGYEPPSQ